jgi:hypothetical protein
MGLILYRAWKGTRLFFLARPLPLGVVAVSSTPWAAAAKWW